MTPLLILAAFTIGWPSCALAQPVKPASQGRSVPGLPGVSAPAPVLPGQPPRPGRGSAGQMARPCPEYGPGFVRLEGGLACVRASGQVRADGVWRGSDARGFGSGVRGRLSLDMRTPTQAGPVRVFVRAEAAAAGAGH